MGHTAAKECRCGNSYGKQGYAQGCRCNADYIGTCKSCVYDIGSEPKPLNISGKSHINVSLSLLNASNTTAPVATHGKPDLDAYVGCYKDEPGKPDLVVYKGNGLSKSECRNRC